MKFNVPSKQFYNVVSAVSKIISSKNAVAILNSLLITLKDDTLTIKAADMENSLEARMKVSEAEGEGSYCIEARRLVDMLKDMPDFGITVDINEENLSVDISYPNGKYNLVATSAAEYPQSKEYGEIEEGTLTFDLPAENAIRAIDSTSYAVSTDTLRPMMTGIFWDIKENCIIFVATDTRKLVKFTDRNIRPGVTGSFIMPMKTAQVLKAAFAKEGDMKVIVNSKGVTFKSDAFTFNSVLIKGNFPPYERVIPSNNPYTMTIDRMAFLNATRRVGGFVAASHGLIKFSITTELLTLRAIDSNYCISARETVPCTFSGSDLTIGFSAPYLVEMLNIITTDDVIVKLSDPSRPGMFLPSEDKDNTELLMLLMPMTVTE
ncbi:MAG: DNA polymerase III subunit beta [Muribaculaceae bacterium]|nr:DNA polymerase III subunit beta [Muribaculaceae bacterium]